LRPAVGGGADAVVVGGGEAQTRHGGLIANRNVIEREARGKKQREN